VVNSWKLKVLDLEARLPEVLSSSEEARAIVLDLAAGESLSEHEVHERAWLIVIDGAIEVTTAAGERASGEAGLLVELAPGERHEVIASSATRLLLLLTPWPGSGHPGAMTIQQKLYTRRHAAKRAR
jgi:quercetin dioxygenase-like cupin family protein